MILTLTGAAYTGVGISAAIEPAFKKAVKTYYNDFINCLKDEGQEFGKNSGIDVKIIIQEA